MHGVGDSEKEKKTVFLTVGTTFFDTLVKAVDSEKVKAELFRSYTNLLIQMGRGSYIPSKVSVFPLAYDLHSIIISVEAASIGTSNDYASFHFIVSTLNLDDALKAKIKFIIT